MFIPERFTPTLNALPYVERFGLLPTPDLTNGRSRSRGRGRNLSGAGAGNFKNGQLRQPIKRLRKV